MSNKESQERIEITSTMLRNHIAKCREMQRSGDNFIKMSNKSIKLSGQTVDDIIKSKSSNEKDKMHEIVRIEDEMAAERYDGDSVTLDSVFSSSDKIVWDGDNIAFMTDKGLLLSANQYEYIRKNGPLPAFKYFAKSNEKDSDLRKTSKYLCRQASEARRDKSKEILYLTFGTVEWVETPATATEKEVKALSPLLFCQINEAPNIKDGFKFKITADVVKINKVVERELKKKDIDLFAGIKKDEISFDKSVKEVLNAIKNNAASYDGVTVNENDINVCTLDSTYETICQLIEKNIDTLAQSPILQVLSGAMSYDELPIKKVADYAVYPMPADDSQREVINSVLQGHSINISAAAGTGKSHLIVLLAANLVTAGKNICVMSEKSAANEVFIKYSKRIGLDKYCIEIDNKMTVSNLVAQVERIAQTARVYLDANSSRALLSEIADVEAWFSKYNQTVYQELPGLDITLYDLIGEALGREEVAEIGGIKGIGLSNFAKACNQLSRLQKKIDTLFTEEDFGNYIEFGTSYDEESDELIGEDIEALNDIGVDVVTFVKANDISAKDVEAAVKANIARKLAMEKIAASGLNKCGSRTLSLHYAQLTDAYAKLQNLYVGYIKQQISERIVRAVSEDTKLVPLIERLRGSNTPLKEFFENYGESLMKLCPIIVTTPSAAVSYINEKINTFDALLIDEASQVPLISVLPFLKDSRQLIVFGDDMQLEITSFFQSAGDSGYDENGKFDLSLTDKSILNIVQGKGIPHVKLKYHYRSKTQHLLTVSNALCYAGMLNITPDVYTGWDKLPDTLGFELVKIDIPFDQKLATDAALRSASAGRDRSKNTYIENYIQNVLDEMVDKVAEKIKTLKQEFPQKSIGVITLNEKFKDTIYDAVEDLAESGAIKYNPDDEENGIWVRALENAQGKEADVIIIAIDHANRNKNGVLHKNISGFFNSGSKSAQMGEKRLNVLFTRAREKNIVFIAFDPKEIKDSSGGMQRLYTYLEYAASGNMSCSVEKEEVTDKTNDFAAETVLNALDNKEVRKKVGSNNLSVDLGVLDKDNDEKFQIGLLLPDRALSLNTLCTKINLLERAGWQLAPMSLVYLLEKPDSFRRQLPALLGDKRPLGASIDGGFNYLVPVAPAFPVTLEEIDGRGKANDLFDIEEEEEKEKEKPEEISRLTVEQYLALDVEEKCRRMCCDYIRNATQEIIDEKFKDNSQASLVKLAQKTIKAAESNDTVKLERLAHSAYLLYTSFEEKRASYLLAQLMRLIDEPENKKEYIGKLLDEATTYIK